MNYFLSNSINELRSILTSLESNDIFDDISSLLVSCISSGHKILFCGNGGSCAEAQHLAAEFTGKFLSDRRPLPALSLTADTSVLTCISNDYGYDHIFARQIRALAVKGDCIFFLSTSGNSNNLVKAAQVASELNITTVALLGRDGGELRHLVDYSYIVPSDSTSTIQEAHLLLGHSLISSIESSLKL